LTGSPAGIKTSVKTPQPLNDPFNLNP
jgi:hypothetical protein